MASAATDLVMHIPKFLDKDRAEYILNTLQALIPWVEFTPSPKSRKVWRFEGLTGDVAIDKIFLDLITELQLQCNVKVQGVFCNLYRDGNDYCPYHRDSYGCDVWTLSLGDTRDFLVKKDVIGAKADKWTLESGDLYFMDKTLHKHYKHSIPVRKNKKHARISLVFFTQQS